MKKTVLAALIGLSLSVSAMQALAAAGKFVFVTGDVKVTTKAGVESVAKVGLEINEGDTIVSGKPGYTQLRFEDGGIAALQANTTLKISKFLYKQEVASKDVVNLELLKGRLRAITGEVGSVHKENYQIFTPIAQMGVRGTDHEAIFIPLPAAGELAVGTPGLYNKVNIGGTYIRNDAGQVDINPAQAGFAAADVNAKPGVLAQIPPIFLSAGADQPKRRFVQVDADAKTIPLVRELPLSVQSVGIAAFSGAGGALTGVALPFSTGSASKVDTGGNAALGVDWGRWTGDYAVPGVAGTTGSLHYINTANLTSADQLAALPGAGIVTANYIYAGGTSPTNELGQAGNVVSATAIANFSTQTINGYTLNANTPGKTWNVSGSGSFAQFASNNGIALSGFCGGCANTMAAGQASGQFAGNAAQGMVTGFGVQSGANTASGTMLLKR